VTRKNHEKELAPDNWATSPKEMMDSETTTVAAALDNPTEALIRVLPGKVYLSLLVDKLGLSKDRYIGLIADALVAKDASGMSALRDDLRAVMSQFMPAPHVNGQ
jgi:hypothetical protein